MQNKIQNYINGNQTSLSNKFVPIIDPSTGEQINEVVLSNENDLEKTIKSSNNAFREWCLVTP